MTKREFDAMYGFDIVDTDDMTDRQINDALRAAGIDMEPAFKRLRAIIESYRGKVELRDIPVGGKFKLHPEGGELLVITDEQGSRMYLSLTVNCVQRDYDPTRLVIPVEPTPGEPA